MAGFSLAAAAGLTACGGGSNEGPTAPINTVSVPAQTPSVCSYTNPNDPTDDPNPLYDGVKGRFVVSSAAIPSGFPTPLSTGLCGAGVAVSDLTASAGLTITTDGTVIDKLDIVGNVRVSANNVTIRRSRITGSSSYTLQLSSGYSNLTVEDTRIRTNNATDVASTSVYLQGSATFRRVHITGGADNMKSNSGELSVESSYITGTYRSTGSHNDVFQSRNGNNYSFVGNTMLGPWQMSTSVFLFQAKTGAGGGPISNVLVANNYLSGGAYTAYTIAPDFAMTNVEVRNNVFEANSSQFGYRNADAASNWHDNYDSTGLKLD